MILNLALYVYLVELYEAIEILFTSFIAVWGIAKFLLHAVTFIFLFSVPILDTSNEIETEFGECLNRIRQCTGLHKNLWFCILLSIQVLLPSPDTFKLFVTANYIDQNKEIQQTAKRFGKIGDQLLKRLEDYLKEK